MAAPWDGRLSSYLGTGAVAARPAAPNLAPGVVGIWFDPAAGGKVYFYDGAWHLLPTGGGGGGGSQPWWWSPPTASEFPTTLGAPAPTLVDDNDVGLIFDMGPPVGGDYSFGVFAAIPTPAADWTLQARCVGPLYAGNYSQIGIVLMDAGQSKCLHVGYDGRREMFFEYFNNPSGYIGAGAEIGYSINDPFYQLIYTASSGVLAVALSHDGKSWQTPYSLNVPGGPFGGHAAYIGLGGGYNRGDGPHNVFSVPRWVFTQ